MHADVCVCPAGSAGDREERAELQSLSGCGSASAV